jgi:hypothetical protein
MPDVGSPNLRLGTNAPCKKPGAISARATTQICQIALYDTIYVTKSTYVETYAQEQRTPKSSVKSEKIQTATLPKTRRSARV